MLKVFQNNAAWFIVTLLVIAATNCARNTSPDGGPPRTDATPKISVETQRSWKDPSEPAQLVGVSESELASMLGPPDTTATVSVSHESRLPEYQSSLYKIAPPSGSVAVRELGWKTAARTIKVWLIARDGGWTSFDALAWSENVRF